MRARHSNFVRNFSLISFLDFFVCAIVCRAAKMCVSACMRAFQLAHSINLAQNAIGHSIQLNKHRRQNRWKEMIRCAPKRYMLLRIESSRLTSPVVYYYYYLHLQLQFRVLRLQTKYGYERAVPLQTGRKDSTFSLKSSPIQRTNKHTIPWLIRQFLSMYTIN